MGLVGSKDETGKVILGSLPPGFLDERGKELRDTLDVCLEKNMWFFSIGGLLLTLPICIKYKTERPFFVAAITCPFADMYFGTLRCHEENEAFREHYKYLQAVYNQPAWQREKQQRERQQELLEQERRLQQQQQQQQQRGWAWRRPPPPPPPAEAPQVASDLQPADFVQPPPQPPPSPPGGGGWRPR